MSILLDLTDTFSIDQGTRFDLFLKYPLNLVNASFVGKIRKLYCSEVIANFQFSGVVWDGTYSFWNAFIPASVTGLMPYSELYLYDILCLIPSSDPIKLLNGKVSINRLVSYA